MFRQSVFSSRAATIAAAAAAAVIFVMGPLATRAADAASLSAAQIVERLRAGGCVLVMRHAQSPFAVPDARTAKTDNPHRERQLDEKGEADARAFGAALRALRIRIGPIYSSPAYRARETVRLAGIGEPKIVEQLSESRHGMSGAAERPQTEWLHRAVSKSPPAGSNTLIVTHTPNIVGAFGNSAAGIKAGESLVFEPDRATGTRLLGRITVEDLQQLARERAGQ
ncbi:MAG TPA: histidine phosphatase family protein [Steroidobacteraceae bacterium]|nr:histidine phosphatase family protein [Steroidobacteraceae bacterium]